MIRFVLCVLFVCLITISHANEFKNYPKADAHFHLVDFLQNSDHLSKDLKTYTVASPYYTPEAGDRGGRIRAALKHMDESNVIYSTVFSMPFIKKWSRNVGFRSGYYLDSSSRVKIARDTDYVVALAIEDFMR